MLSQHHGRKIQQWVLYDVNGEMRGVCGCVFCEAPNAAWPASHREFCSPASALLSLKTVHSPLKHKSGPAPGKQLFPGMSMLLCENILFLTPWAISVFACLAVAQVKPETGKEWGALPPHHPLPILLNIAASPVFFSIKGEHLWGSSGAQNWWFSFWLTSWQLPGFVNLCLLGVLFLVVFRHPLLPCSLFPISCFLFLALSCVCVCVCAPHFRISQSLWPTLQRVGWEPKKEGRKDTAAQFFNLFFSFETAARAHRSGFGKGTDPSHPF